MLLRRPGIPHSGPLLAARWIPALRFAAAEMTRECVTERVSKHLYYQEEQV